MQNTDNNLRKGFTLIELLAVVVLVGILAVLLIPVVGKTREQFRQATCASNLRQIGMASFLYANDNNGRLPEITIGYWPHDIDRVIMEELLALGGNDVNSFYCPSDLAPGRWVRWHNLADDFLSISYLLLFEGAINVRPQFWNSMVGEPQPYELRGELYFESSSQRVLALDAVMSVGGINGNFHRINTPAVSADWYDQTNHLNGTAPAGGNILFLDGHVEFRTWAEMLQNRQKFGARTAGSPEFYW